MHKYFYQVFWEISIYNIYSVRNRMKRRYKTLDHSNYTDMSPSSINDYKNKDVSYQQKEDSLQRFQEQLSVNILDKLKLKKQKNKIRQYRTLNDENQKSIDQIKRQIGKIKYYLQKQMQQQKLYNQLLSNQIKYNKQSRHSILPQIHNPYFYPSYQVQQKQIQRKIYRKKHKKHKKLHNKQYQQSQQQDVRHDKKVKAINAPTKKKYKITSPAQKIRLKKLCRKAFYAVSYTVFLKNLVKKLINKRKLIFQDLWPAKFRKSSMGISNWLFNSLQPFFKQMYRIRNTSIVIQGDESAKLLNEKKIVNLQLVSLFVKCCYEFSSDIKFEQVCKIMHHFCKHGAQSSHKALTRQELETVCISQIHGYLRMDKSLQKSQIINFLFFKIIIYNIILQPGKYNSQKFNKQNKQLYNNLHYFASVLYQILNQTQEDLLQSQHQKPIVIGNWKSVSSKFKIEPSDSLCYFQNNYEPGQMISGLVSQRNIKNTFSNQFLQNEKQMIQTILEKMHKKISKTHQQFIQKNVYSYKKKF